MRRRPFFLGADEASSAESHAANEARRRRAARSARAAIELQRQVTTSSAILDVPATAPRQERLRTEANSLAFDVAALERVSLRRRPLWLWWRALVCRRPRLRAAVALEGSFFLQLTTERCNQAQTHTHRLAASTQLVLGCRCQMETRGDAHACKRSTNPVPCASAPYRAAARAIPRSRHRRRLSLGTTVCSHVYPSTEASAGTRVL